MEKTEQKVSVLTKEKVILRPIVRPSDWLPEGHDSEFMNEGARWTLCVPMDRYNKRLIDPLADLNMEQKEQLANDLGIDKISRFNVHNPDNFWKNFEIQLDRSGRELNLEDPYDFITYKVLLANKEWIAPSWSLRNMKQTYKYALEHENEKMTSELSEVNRKEASYVALKGLSESVDNMKDFMWVYYLQNKAAPRPPINPTHDWLRKEIGKIIEQDSKSFLDIIQDKNYSYKVIIIKALHIGALSREGDMYRFPGSEFNVGTLDQMIDHLRDPRYQEDFLKLKTQINISETATLKDEVKKTGDQKSFEKKLDDEGGDIGIKLPEDIKDVQEKKDGENDESKNDPEDKGEKKDEE